VLGIIIAEVVDVHVVENMNLPYANGQPQALERLAVVMV
jgi:hypothetical protein